MRTFFSFFLTNLFYDNKKISLLISVCKKSFIFASIKLNYSIMYIHKEGYKISILSIVFAAIVTAIMFIFVRNNDWILYFSVAVCWILAFVIVRFFRMPKRELVVNENKVISSADGTIVVVEQVYESEFLKTDCIQVSTFMSPNNVHVNRYPISGKIIYTKYYDGKKLYARNPKSSFLNERTSVCIEHENGKRVLVRQIAGALARRIVCYAKEGETVKQGEEMGFIKFGSRVDLLIPIDSEIHVEIEDKVRGGQSIIATL